MNEIYDSFCSNLLESYFEESFRGDEIFFSVDESFIVDTCKQLGIDKEQLFHAVTMAHDQMDDYKSFEKTIGIIAIQIYAASLRENSENATEKAYYIRLMKVLDLNKPFLDKWNSLYQEKIWTDFYYWCENHYFYVNEVTSKSGRYRYVQFPVSQALLNKEDLKLVTGVFRNIYLQPYEYISYEDFKYLVEPELIRNRDLHAHFNRIYLEKKRENNSDVIIRQLYSFYRRWNGDLFYVHKNSFQKRKDTASKETLSEQYYLTYNEQALEIEIRDIKDYVIIRLDIRLKSSMSKLVEYYCYKRPNEILFSKDDTYNVWKECRYIEKGREGLLVMNSDNNDFKCIKSHFYNLVVKDLGCFIVIKISNSYFIDYFSRDTQQYKLEGGLKLGRSEWLYNAGPFLTFYSPNEFFIDGENKNVVLEQLSYDLSSLQVGLHRLKVKGHKTEEFNIVEPRVQTYGINGLHYDSKDATWKSTSNQEEISVIGADFSSFCREKFGNEKPLKQWMNIMSGRSFSKKSNSNIVAKLLKNQNDGII